MAMREGRNTNNFGKIGILMGGVSSEREISLNSGKSVYEAFKRKNFDLAVIDIVTLNIKEIMKLIKSAKIDCAFLALHGYFGEDGQIQEILDSLRIPYTGSGALASRLAMDKIAAHKIFEDSGLNTAGHMVFENKLSVSCVQDAIIGHFSFPVVVKPAMQGSSVGLNIVDKKEDLVKAVALAFSFDNRIIVEDYIKGRELTIGLLADEVLPIIEIVPKKRFFDYEAKYMPGRTDYIVPAKLDSDVLSDLRKAAFTAHNALGCFGCSRVDMILNKEKVPFILEVNTIPGLTENSLLPKAARAKGISFEQLCVKLIELAYEKAQR